MAERRAAEVREAAAILGVARHEFLGYRDSGMAGEASNADPGCLATADVDGAAGRLVAILEAEGADVLVTYDEHGGYGHPDHVQVHRVGIRAAELAGTPRVFMVTQDRDHVRSLFASVLATAAAVGSAEGADGADGVGGSQWEPPEETAVDLETMGEPGYRITTDVDVTDWLDAKRRAMRAHASQISETSFFVSMPDDVFAQVWGTEWYIRVRPPVPDPFEGPRQHGLSGLLGSSGPEGAPGSGDPVSLGR